MSKSLYSRIVLYSSLRSLMPNYQKNIKDPDYLVDFKRSTGKDYIDQVIEVIKDTRVIRIEYILKKLKNEIKNS